VAIGSGIVLRLENAGALSGHAMADGRGVDAFDITLFDERSGFSLTDTFSHTAGRWRIEGVPAGAYVMRARSMSGAAKVGVELQSGETRDDIQLVLEPSASIRGRVLDLETGLPLAGMRVLAQDVDAGEIGMAQNGPVTGVDGMFVVPNAPVGRVLLSAYNPDWQNSSHGGASIPMRTRAGDKKETSIRLPRARIPLTVRGAELGFTWLTRAQLSSSSRCRCA
jgi:hypothetical protein